MIASSEHIVLRELHKDDAPLVVKWENEHDADGMRPLSGYTLRDIREYISDAKGIMIDMQQRFIIEEKGTKRVVGAIDLFDLDFDEDIVKVGVLIADPADRGKGYGKEAVEEIVKYALLTIRVAEVLADVKASNEVSRKLFEQCGFEEEDEQDGIVTYVIAA